MSLNVEQYDPTDDPQIIYFEAIDEERDGFGWNVVDADLDHGCIAARFGTLAQAVAFCDDNGWPHTVTEAPS